MNASSRIALFLIAGTAAGLLTWLLSDVFGPISGLIRLPDEVGTQTAAQARQQLLVGMIFGASVGALLGAAEGLAAGSPAQARRAAGAGLLVGAFAGLIGLTLGGAFFGLYVAQTTNPLVFLWNVFVRALSWGFIGALVGTADGWRKGSFRVGRNGLIGGLLGGLIGGAAFEITPYLLLSFPRPGIVSRLLGFVITGAAIGLFVALVQQLFKQAWLRVPVGRNEGREYLVEKVETRIGRAELSDVPLFGDPLIARTHAILVARPGGAFVLRDAGSEGGTRVNGAPLLGEQPLRDGDRIEIGSRTLLFHERAARQPAPAPNRDRAGGRGAPPHGAPLRPSALADALPAPGGDGAARGGAPGGGAPRLVVTEGPHAGKAFPLASEAVIGRDPSCDIALPEDVKASRTHARIRRVGASFVIEDAGSTNGTFVNGRRVQRQALVAGDTVLIGSSALLLEG